MKVNRYFNNTVNIETLYKQLIDLRIQQLVNTTNNSPTSHKKNHLGGV